MNVTETWQCDYCKFEYPEKSRAAYCYGQHTQSPNITQWFKCGTCKEICMIRERAEECCRPQPDVSWGTRHNAVTFGIPIHRGTLWRCVWQQNGCMLTMESTKSAADAWALAERHSNEIATRFGDTAA